MGRLDLNLLLVLDALFDERNVTAVARRLRVSQPTVSFSLKKLRDFFNDELFVRQGATMQPTPFIETIHEPLRRIIETIHQEILCEYEFDPLTTERSFTFGLSDVGDLIFLPPILEALRVVAPRATVQSQAISPNELQAAMADGRIDMALGCFPDLVGAGFFQQKLFEHPFICIVRHGHPAICGTMTVDQFMAADHVDIASGARSHQLFAECMAELKLERRIVLRTQHYLSIPMLVANSDMIAVVPRAVGRAFAGVANLKLVEPPVQVPHIEVKQFWHRRAHNEPGIVWMRKLLAQLFLHRDPSSDPQSPIFGGKLPRQPITAS
jgi:DNA-binding transcriptional LysR family regulator